MVNFIDIKIENEPIHERHVRIDRMMNYIVWGNTKGYMGGKEKDTTLQDEDNTF